MGYPKIRITVAYPPAPSLLPLREELARIRAKYQGMSATRRNLAARQEEIDHAYRRHDAAAWRAFKAAYDRS